MEKPMIENELWQKAFAMNPALQEAIMNPNTDFLTKLLFDARFLQKKHGKEIHYWTNAIFKVKMYLHEKKGATEQQIVKGTGLPSSECSELLNYLKNMSEILMDDNGKHALNYTNMFSKVFKG